MVSFDYTTTTDYIIEQINKQCTPLISFFKYNTTHPHDHSHLYQDFLTMFTWDY